MSEATTMMLAWICAGLIAGTPTADPAPPPAADAQQSYREARAQAGRSPEEQVKLALWCEAHGLTAERLHHLTLAVLADPKNVVARGLMGLVSHDGRWQRPEAVSEKARADADLAARLADYNGRRARTPDQADAQWKLALWCEENGLRSEATAHFLAVVRLDPSRENAWKKLGCKKYEGRWLNDAAIAAEKAEVEAQKLAEKKWKPLLEKYRDALKGKDQAKRLEAEKALDDLTDPRAVRRVWATFATGGASGQAIAVRVLGQIDAPSASRALALLAVFADSAEVRRAATETLKLRDPREYAGLLVGLIRDEVRYEVRPVNGPGSPGALFVQGQQFNVQRLYAPPAIPANLLTLAGWGQTDMNGMPIIGFASPVFTRTQTTTIGHQDFNYWQFLQFRPTDPGVASVVSQAQQDAPETLHGFLAHAPHNRALAKANPDYLRDDYGYKIVEDEVSKTPMQTETVIPVGQMILEYQKSAAVAQQQLQGDIAAVDRYNIDVKNSNDRVTQVLRAISGKDYKVDRERWKAWYIDLKGYAYTPAPEQPRPTIVQNVPLAYQPQMVPILQFNETAGPTDTSITDSTNIMTRIPSCFGAGTMIRTFTGPQAIETLRVGDRVLTQSTSTGALGYRPIVGVHHNPPSPTFLIKVAGDTIVSSPFHRFWKAGKGWVMAREIRAGDRLRLLDGVSEVTGVDEGKVQLVYNLDVSDDADFFAGNAAALVHDNTLPDPRLVPFDAGLKVGAVAQARRAD
jgi:Pretoxin HINT domain